MVNTTLEENMIEQVEILANEILNKMRNGNRAKVREYSKYFDEIIDSYCLDRIHTYHKTMGHRTWFYERRLMIVTENDLKNYKIYQPYCDICGKAFKLNESYEKITTHSKRKLIIHTDCIGK